MSRHLAGTVGVDSGQLLIVDPCYLRRWKDGDFVDGRESDNDYARACVASLSELGAGNIEGNVDAVCTSTGWGDGTYPIYVEKDRDGRIVRAIIEFDEADAEGNDLGEDEEDEEVC